MDKFSLGKEGTKWYGINGGDVIQIEENSNRIMSYSNNPMDLLSSKGDDLGKKF